MATLAPVELRTVWWKAALMLAASMGFVAAALFLPDRPGDSGSWHWLGGLFFGLCGIVGFVMLVRPQRILLDQNGFTISGGLARAARKVRWDDIEPLFLYRLPRGGQMVGFNYRPGVKPDTQVRRILRRAGADGMLPRMMPGSASSLAERCNEYRAAALARIGVPGA